MSEFRPMNARDSAFQQFETLKRNREKRARQGLFFLEGVHPVEQAVKAGFAFYAVGIDADARLSGWARDMLERAKPEIVYRMKRELHAELSDRAEPCELVCLARMRTGLPDFPYDARALYLIYDRPTSPGNLGTIIRSADAFGARCVITTGHAADFYDPKCIRASVGALFHMPHINMGGCESAVSYLRARPEKPRILGTSARAGQLISEIDCLGATALVIGNETFGMSKAWHEACDAEAKIPIGGAASSLNAASAASICLYEIARQRGG